MKILITAGGTRDYIDSVRFISNISTGKTACTIANFLTKKHEIIYLCSEAAKFPENKKIKIKKFISFKDLNAEIKNILESQNIDAIIHSAAVGDYSIRCLKAGERKLQINKSKKISSKSEELTIVLKRNFKIIDRIKTYSKNKKIILIGFKLTNGATKTEIKKAVLNLKTADIVAHNDLLEMQNTHPFHIYQLGNKISTVPNAAKLAAKLDNLLQGENYAACT
jgi:phosphopantothenoylcysteine synthetase/decarboxylase